nr:MAG TPA: hypothetical protein [Caudoviricetes sp.]
MNLLRWSLKFIFYVMRVLEIGFTPLEFEKTLF